MNNLILKAFSGFIFLMIVMGAFLFIPAGTLNYWQGWLFLLTFGLSALLITLYLMKNDSKLLEKRVYGGPIAEKEKLQKVIQSIASVGFVGILVVSVLDYRLMWSNVPWFVSIIGDILVAIGFLIIFFVFKQNSFASAIIEHDSDQKLISTGLYSLVRHPMYMGAIFLFIGIPLSLGSYWGFLVYALMWPALLWRLFDEEKYLAKNLPGYVDYQKKVKYHLVPFIW